MLELISKKFADIKMLHEGYTADYFLNRIIELFKIIYLKKNLRYCYDLNRRAIVNLRDFSRMF
jgi:hypothetical protein